MPAAAQSYSSQKPERQQSGEISLPSHIVDSFDDIRCMLEAFNAMNNAILFTGTDHSGISYGVHRLHDLIEDRLEETVKDVHAFAKKLELSADVRTDEGRPDKTGFLLMMRLTTITAAIWRESGRKLDNDDPECTAAVTDIASAICSRVMSRLEDRGDLLEAGAHLPWAEDQIREAILEGAEEASSIDTIVRRFKANDITP